jgi:hypothetical protein
LVGDQTINQGVGTDLPCGQAVNLVAPLKTLGLL